MRIVLASVIAIALSGCLSPNPGHSTPPPVDPDCGCLDGWVCCAPHQCAPSSDQCQAGPPDMSAPPDMTHPISADLVFSTGGVNFPPTPVNTRAAPVSVSVTNRGGQAVTLYAVNLTNDDKVLGKSDIAILASSTCQAGLTLSPGDACVVDLEYEPIKAGNENIYLAVGTPGADYILPLNATATSSTIGLSADPASLVFTDVPLGQGPATLTVNVTNRGNAPTGTLNSFVSDDKALMSVSGCAQELAIGGTCTLTVSFSPLSEGSYQGTVHLSDNTPAGTLLIPVKANSISAPQLSISMAGPFADTWMGESSPPKTFHVVNRGAHPTGAVSISKPSRAFVIDSDGCSGQQLSGGASCDVTVHFVAVKRGNNLESLSASASPGGTSSAILQGHGIQHATLSIGDDGGNGNLVMTTVTGKAVHTLTIYNTGDETTGAVTWQFAAGSNSRFFAGGCTSAINAGGSCTALIYFNTRTTGSFTDTLTISDGPRNTLTEGLTGTFNSPLGVLLPSPASLSASGLNKPYPFAPVTVWNTSPQASGTLTTTLTGSGFAATADSCNGNALDGGATCSVSITFTPTFTGTFPGTLVVSDGTNSATVTLSAGALLPAFSFTPAALDFGSVGIGQAGPPVSVTVTNVSNRDAPTGYSLDNDAFWVVGGDCPATLTVGSSCTLSLRFGPRAGGTLNGNLTFAGTEGVPTLALTGVGQ
jgi:hypothetical protein